MAIQSIQDVIKQIIQLYQEMEGRRVDIGFGMSMRGKNPVVSGLNAYIANPEGLSDYLSKEIPKLLDGAKSKSLLQLLHEVVLFLEADSVVSSEAIVASLSAFAMQQQNASQPTSEKRESPSWFAWSASLISAKSLQQDTVFLNDCRDLLLGVIDFIGRTKPSFNESSEAKKFKSGLGLGALQEQTYLENQQSILFAALELLSQTGGASAAASSLTASVSVITGEQKEFLAVIEAEQRVTKELRYIANQIIKPKQKADMIDSLKEKQIELEAEQLQLQSKKQEFLKRITSNPAAADLAAQNLHRQLEDAQAELRRVGMRVDQAAAEAELRLKAQFQAETDKQQRARAAVERAAQVSAAKCAELELAMSLTAQVTSAQANDIESLTKETKALRTLESALRSEIQRLKVQAARDKSELDMAHADLRTTHAFYHLAESEFSFVTAAARKKLLELRLSDFEFSDRFKNLMALAKQIDFEDVNFSSIKTIYSQLIMQQQNFVSIYAPLFEAGYKLSDGAFHSIQSQYQSLSELFFSIMKKCREDQQYSVSFSGKKALTPGEKVFMEKSNFLKAGAACAEELAKRLENLMGQGVVLALKQESYAEFIANFQPFCQRNLALINTSVEAMHKKSMVTVQASFFPPAPSVPASEASLPAAQADSDSECESVEDWSDHDGEVSGSDSENDHDDKVSGITPNQ